MIQNNKAIAAYQKAELELRIISANQEELVSMLLNGAIQSIKKGIIAGKNYQISLKAQNFCKAIRIISYGLHSHLDYASGGELANNLSYLYDYCCQKLLENLSGYNEEAINNVLSILEDLKLSWETAFPSRHA